MPVRWNHLRFWICFYPEQSFRSDSEGDVFQQLLYLRVPHHTSPTIRSLTGFSLQCFTTIFHTSLHNGRKIKPKKRANIRPTRRGQVTACGADRKTLIWKLLFSILFYEHLAKYYVVPDLRKTRWLPRNILIFEDMLLEYLEVGSEVETAHLRWNN